MASAARTPWTPSIRFAVMVWFGFGVLWSLVLPLWAIPIATNTWLFANYHELGPPSADQLAQATTAGTQIVWSWTAVTVAIDVFAIAAVLRRPT